MLASGWLSCFGFIHPWNMNDGKKPPVTHILHISEILARRNQDTVGNGIGRESERSRKKIEM